MKINDTIYAVTDQHVLLELTVTKADGNIEDLEGWTRVATQLAGESSNRHETLHHRTYFADFFLDEDGIASRSGIYTLKADAISAINDAINKELAAIESKRATLLAKQSALLEA